MLDDNTRYTLLKTLEANPAISQREMSRRLGISLGKVNYCLNALVEKGCLKVNNFRNSNNKLGYAYLLTPKGVDEVARMTVVFLRCKMREYEQLSNEIEILKREAADRGLLENAYD
jgi:EPS-associated MarR family transcriptional regulator